MSTEPESNGTIDQRLKELGLILPAPLVAPAGVKLPFQNVRLLGSVAYVAGHAPLAPDGSLAQPLGKLGRDLDVDQGYAAARLTALAVLASLRRTLGSLDRIVGWGRVFGMVASADGFVRQPEVINGFSDLLVEVFGADVGAHARSAVGMAELPFHLPVEVEAIVHVAAEV
jgi:enamine deaminase RidA (YjgF/YER057c/UK114 family)